MTSHPTPFHPLNSFTSSYSSLHKALVYAFHGWGKTTQAKHMQERYGKTLILSGESGLRSIRDTSIDYLPFASWDDPIDPAAALYSVKSLYTYLISEDFKERDYKVIFIDSLTEMSDRCFEHFKKEIPQESHSFRMYAAYSTAMLGALKAIRDLPYHVVMTALAKQEENNTVVQYWPMVNAQTVQKKLAGLVDHVLCGVRVSSDDANPTQRFIVTDEYKGWHGKIRDPSQRLAVVERSSNIADLFHRLDMSEDEYATYLTAQSTSKEEPENV